MVEKFTDGTCYHIRTEGIEYIFLKTKDNWCDNIAGRREYYKAGGFGSVLRDKGYTEAREATSEEEQWLKACIEAGKFIPLNEITTTIDNYQIF